MDYSSLEFDNSVSVMLVLIVLCKDIMIWKEKYVTQYLPQQLYLVPHMCSGVKIGGVPSVCFSCLSRSTSHPTTVCVHIAFAVMKMPSASREEVGRVQIG